MLSVPCGSLGSGRRIPFFTIGGQEYPLILTTLATKEIGKRYGGLENLGERLMKAENFALALEEINYLIVLLANQSVLLHNFTNPNDKKELLTAEYVELFTEPHELATYKAAITSCMFKGTQRHIESEEKPGKNKQGG
ncbi:MAG: hypothetical protein FWF79_06290 [Defluviitaleaceae bacterium]|nr:hypothetical protein [Defluviitaleaceae bacterium]